MKSYHGPNINDCTYDPDSGAYYDSDSGSYYTQDEDGNIYESGSDTPVK